MEELILSRCSKSQGKVRFISRPPTQYLGNLGEEFYIEVVGKRGNGVDIGSSGKASGNKTKEKNVVKVTHLEFDHLVGKNELINKTSNIFLSNFLLIINVIYFNWFRI